MTGFAFNGVGFARAGSWHIRERAKSLPMIVGNPAPNFEKAIISSFPYGY
jgi:hypothetical protein